MKLLYYYFYNHINNKFDVIEELLTKQIVPFFNKYLHYIIKEQITGQEQINIKNNRKIAELDNKINKINKISSFKSNKSITSITELDNNYTKYNKESDYIDIMKNFNTNSFKQEEEKLYEYINFINNNKLELYPETSELYSEIELGGGSYSKNKIFKKKIRKKKKDT